MKKDGIVNLFYERKEEAVQEAQKAYGAYLFSIASRILSDKRDAEEAVNDAYLAAWNSIPPQDPENLKTYLGKLCREGAIDRLRQNTAKKRAPAAALLPLEELEEAVGEGGVEEHVQAAELSRRISAFLHEEKADARRVFLRRYWYFDPIGEIAARFGFSESRVRMMLKRTRDRLHATLKKEGYLNEK